MTQRNPMNERYNDEKRGGKTRKSAASAKPSAERAATVHSPAPKTAKQKKQEARERARAEKEKPRYTVETHDNRYIENLPQYKKLRKLWWGCILAASILIMFSILSAGYDQFSMLYIPCIVLGYLFVMGAFYIDFVKIRRLRREYASIAQAQGKSKESRAAQKKARAEAREQQREAQEKFDAAQAAEAEKKQNGFLARFRKPKAAEGEDAPAKSEDAKEK